MSSPAAMMRWQRESTERSWRKQSCRVASDASHSQLKG